MITMGFFLLSYGKLLLNQWQRKLRSSGCSICYIKAVSAASKMTSGPAKGLRWRSHLSGRLFQPDKKLRQNFTQKSLPYCPLCPSVVTFSRFLWIHLRNTIWWAKCFTLPSEACNPPTGAAQQRLQEVPEHELWCPPDGGYEECGSLAARGLSRHADLHSTIFSGNPAKTSAGRLSAEGRRALCVCSKQAAGATDVPQPQQQLDHSVPLELLRYLEPLLFIFLIKLCELC